MLGIVEEKRNPLTEKLVSDTVSLCVYKREIGGRGGGGSGGGRPCF